MENLRSLPDCLGNLKQLSSLDLHCPVEALPGTFSHLHSLQHLKLWCWKLQELPPGMERLTRLETLDITASELRCQPPSSLEVITELPSLRCLHLSDMSELRSLPDPLGGLTQLEELHIIRYLEILPPASFSCSDFVCFT